MKRFALILVFSAFVSFGAGAQEFAFGAKAGFCASWLPGYPVLEYSQPLPHNAFYGGLSAECTFADDLLLQTELLYSRKGHSASDYALNEHYSHSIDYFQVPFYVGMKFGGEAFSVMIGPELGFVLGDRVKAPQYLKFDDYRINPVQLFIALQMTYMMGDVLGFDLKFDFGASHAFEGGARAMSAQIGVCCKFGS